jgi:hypothetical protein
MNDTTSATHEFARPSAKPADVTQGVVALTTAASASASVLHEVVEIVRVCAECAKTIGVQQTERYRVKEEARVQIDLIRSRRELLERFLDGSFAERRHNFGELFERLDLALAQDSPEATREILGAIVSLATSSPFEALRDAATAHEALLDKSLNWEF